MIEVKHLISSIEGAWVRSVGTLINSHPKIVQERLGHSSIQITLDTYSHITPGLQEAAAQRFDDVMLPHKETAKVTP